VEDSDEVLSDVPDHRGWRMVGDKGEDILDIDRLEKEKDGGTRGKGKFGIVERHGGTSLPC